VSVENNTRGSLGETGVSVEQLITEHLDIWTAADTEKKSGRGRTSGNAGSVYGIKKLRELILELAVRGKLVPQDASDEPASELLKKIAAEKAKLIAEGKVKKSKPLEPISEEEKLFSLPHGWQWVRLGDVCSYIQRGKGPAYVDNSDFFVISQKCVRWTGLDLSQARFIDPESVTKYEAIRLLCEGDILWNSTGTGTIGRACLVPPLVNQQFLVADSHVTVVRPIGLWSIFLWRWIHSPSVQSQIEGVASGTTNQIELNTSTVISHLFPLPPLAEQHRIVAKVDELMALCDQLENQHNNAAEAHEKLVTHLLGTLTQSQNAEDFNTNWQRISEYFDTLFTTEASIDALKQTLLQLAVMGKLVPQDPNDEPASELLKRIQAEKAKLIAEGKIKKDKPLAEITEVEKPFELPINWKWIRLGALVNTSDSGWSPSCDASPRVGTDWGVLKVSAVSWGKFLPNENKSLPKSLNARLDCEVRHGDFLISRANTAELVAKSVVIEDCPPNLMLSDKIVRLRLTSFCNSKFINLVNSSSFARIYYSLIAGGTSSSMKNVTREQILNLIIPLPPLAEHQRIVEKVDELIIVCDQLKAQLISANQLQKKLADVVIEQAIS
jgi:type I restriction enzyme S subunit